MNKFFRALVVLVAVATSGCATVNTPQGSRTFVYVQRGIMLQVTHTFTDTARIYQAGSASEFSISGAMPRNVPLGPATWGDQTIYVTLQSLNELGEVVMSCSASFQIDGNSTVARTLFVGKSTVSTGGYGSVQCLR